MQEEIRLRAKALREQRQAEQRASGAAPTIPKSASGFVPTSEVYVAKVAQGKRSYQAMNDGAVGGTAAAGAATEAPVPAEGRSSTAGASSQRDGRLRAPEEALRPAPKFAKFVDFNMSSMTDTKGGFLSAEDDPHNYALGVARSEDQPQRPRHMDVGEWERLQLLNKLRRQKAGPFEPGLSVLDDEADKAARRCRECGSLEIDFLWLDVFHICVCAGCKERFPDKYSLLTKTECKEDYLLTDGELRDADLLPHLSRPNPHKSHWHDMMLFLRLQVEEYAVGTKWGSAEAMDAEFARREAQKKTRAEAKFRSKLLDLKRKTRSEAFRRRRLGHHQAADGAGPSRFGDTIGSAAGRHVHEWGQSVDNAEGVRVKTCLECGMEVEELEL